MKNIKPIHSKQAQKATGATIDLSNWFAMIGAIHITTNAKYDIYKEGKKLDENEIVSTNSQLVISSEIKYELIVIGDVDGNGESNIKDIMSINKHRLEKLKLTGVYLQAGDVNGDGKVDIKDIMKINKYRLGKINNL